MNSLTETLNLFVSYNKEVENLTVMSFILVASIVSYPMDSDQLKHMWNLAYHIINVVSNQQWCALIPQPPTSPPPSHAYDASQFQ